MNKNYYNLLKSRMKKHKGKDPQDKLDDETLKEYADQIEEMEAALEDISDAKRKGYV